MQYEEPDRMIPTDIEEQLDGLRHWMTRFVAEYSQGVAWITMIGMLAALTGDSRRLLDRAGEVDGRARVPLTSARRAAIEAAFAVPDTLEDLLAEPDEQPHALVGVPAWRYRGGAYPAAGCPTRSRRSISQGQDGCPAAGRTLRVGRPCVATVGYVEPWTSGDHATEDGQCRLTRTS